MSMNQEVFFCGLHKFKTTNKRVFCIHLIDDHDSEHGKHQLAGTKNWSVLKPVKLSDGTYEYGEPEIDYGVFRYLPIFESKDCDEKVSLWGVSRNPTTVEVKSQ